MPGSGGQVISYVDKSARPWKINGLQLMSNTPLPFLNTLGEVEDYCWLPGKSVLFSSRENFIMKGSPGQNWNVFQNMNDLGIEGTISRMAISPNGQWMAVVIEAPSSEE